MKIRTALTLKYTCITATIFLLCMVLIYLVSEHTRDQTFFRNLKSEGITKANLFLAGQVDAKTMQSVYLNNRKFINEVEVAVYTTDFHMLYHDAIHNDIVKETEGMIKEIIQKKRLNSISENTRASEWFSNTRERIILLRLPLMTATATTTWWVCRKPSFAFYHRIVAALYRRLYSGKALSQTDKKHRERG